MKTSYFVAGALALCLVPATLLLPGCGGGGGSSSAPNLRFTRARGVDFPDFPGLSGVLSVDFADTSGTNARAAGTLRVFNRALTPTATPTPNGTSDLTVSLAPGTYLLRGNLTRGQNADYALDLRGSYPDGPPFTLFGDFDSGSTISIRANFQAGNSVLVGRLTDAVVTPVPTGTPSITPTTMATPLGTATATVTPIGTATAFPTITAAPTATATTTTPIAPTNPVVPTTAPPRVP